ncbi:hypothetical protein GpartN1_g6958.t1 [Galdieria partita]|uniref:Profilin n=1 Tax=Galdieria partita TaxID=83374 RepID=A0A9C7Q3Y3_9RHOD|nr:hypothetical protein GpartN1_g6958.t1 [Galdieria partita]
MSWSSFTNEDLNVEWSRKIHELVNNQYHTKITGVALLLQPGYCVASYGDLRDSFHSLREDNSIILANNTDNSFFISKEAKTLFEVLESVVFSFTQTSNNLVGWKPILFQQEKYIIVKATECSCLAITKNRKKGLVLSQLAQGLLLVTHFKSPSVPNIVYCQVELFADNFRKIQ